MIRLTPRHASLAALLALLVTPSWGGGPEAHLQLSGSGPYYRMEMPLGWQAHSGRMDLGDVRLLNAQGRALPYAWLDTPDPVAIEQRHELPLFQWRGPKAPPGPHTHKLPAWSPTAPSWPIWVMDLRQLRGHIRQLQLSLPDDAHGIFAFAVESSSDLQSWRTELEQVQVAHLAHQGQSLRQELIELGGLRTPYLRLRLLPGSPEPSLGQVIVRTTDEAQSTPPWSWSGPIRPSACGPQHCDYPVPSRVPLGRLKVRLTEANTLLSLQVLGEPSNALATTLSPANTEHEHRHGLRDRLRALRHKSHEDAPTSTPPAQDPDAGWQWLSEGQVHWIDQADRQIRAEELPLNQDRYRMLRLRTHGGDSSWTRQPPAIEVATWSRSLVFLGRGPQPFRLSWADPASGPSALSPAQLLPGHTPQEAPEAPAPGLTTGVATLPEAAGLPHGAPTGAAAHTATARNTASAPQGAASATSAAGPLGRIPPAWWLWAALLLGLGVMAYMARTLLSPKDAA